jgi:adhesin/invasin
LKSDASTPLTASGGRVVLHSAAGSLGAVTDVGNGTYTATFDPPDAAGDIVVWATLNGLVLEDVAVITVEPAAASAAASSVSVARTALPADTRSSTTVTATVRDAYGNVRTAGGDTVAMTVSGGGSISSVNDNGDGTYSASLTSAASVGTSVVAVTVGGTAAGSVSVLRTRVSEVTTMSTLSVPSTATAGGSTVTATVQLSDGGGNISGDIGDVVIRSTAGSVGSTSFAAGLYTAAITPPTTTGTVLIWATLDGVALSDSAEITVNPGSASTGASTVTASSTSLSADGSSTSTITVALRDAYSNPLTASGGTVVVSVASGSGSVGAVTDNTNGTYTATYTAESVAGVARIEATVGGSNIADAAFITLTATASTPIAPTGLSVDAIAETSVDLSWTAPSDTGGSAISSYTIQYRLSSAASWTDVTSSGSGTSSTVTGLTGGSTYAFRVAATNDTGTGAPSAEVTVSTTSPTVAPSAPGQPTALAGTPGVRSVSLTWTAPTSDGGASITDYTVEYSSDSGSNWTTFADGTSASTRATVTGLTDGTEYTFRVSAVNSAGTGTASATETVTPGVPGAPTSFAAADGADGTATLTWSTPSSGGSDIIRYLVSYSSDSGSTWSAEAAAVSGDSLTLADGTYEVRVRAENAAGFGEYATDSVTVTGTPPPPP